MSVKSYKNNCAIIYRVHASPWISSSVGKIYAVTMVVLVLYSRKVYFLTSWKLLPSASTLYLLTLILAKIYVDSLLFMFALGNDQRHIQCHILKEALHLWVLFVVKKIWIHRKVIQLLLCYTVEWSILLEEFEIFLNLFSNYAPTLCQQTTTIFMLNWVQNLANQLLLRLN